MTNWEAMVSLDGDAELWLSGMGQGSPAIILESPGPHCDSSLWIELQLKLAQWACTYRYDRAGTGRSSGIELSTPLIPPRTRDLERMLEAAAIQPPYVMVGYSLGGAIVLRYARQHLERMAGLVLIDSASELLMARRAGETEPVLPDTGKEPPLGDLPLVVITVETKEYILPPIPDATPAAMLKTWMALQAELAALSTQGQQQFVKGTDHYRVLETHPGDVIEAVKVVLEQARK